MPCLSSWFRYFRTCLLCIALLCLAAPSMAAPRKQPSKQEEQKELHMWHDTEGIVHIKDQKPEDEEVGAQQFADDLHQPNPDVNATAPAETATPEGSRQTAPGEETAAPAADMTAPDGQTQPAADQSPQTAVSPAEPQPGTPSSPESSQSVVRPMQPRPGQMQPGQNIPPELQKQLDEARKDMPPEVQQQMDQAMREMQQHFGQQQPEMSPGMLIGMFGAALVPAIVIGLLFYVIFCFVLSRIGKKFFIGTFLEWLIPFYNLILLARCAGLSPWFAAPSILQFALTILMIPLVFSNPLFAMSMASLVQIIGIIGYIAMAVIFGNIAKRLGKNLVLWVILMLIPLVQLVCGLILAFDSSRPILDGEAIPSGPSGDLPPRRRRGKSGSQPDEPPLLSAPPKPARRKNPLDDDDATRPAGSPPFKP